MEEEIVGLVYYTSPAVGLFPLSGQVWWSILWPFFTSTIRVLGYRNRGFPFESIVIKIIVFFSFIFIFFFILYSNNEIERKVRKEEANIVGEKEGC